MAENRFAKSVKAAKERTDEIKEQHPENVSEPKVDNEVKSEPVKEETPKKESTSTLSLDNIVGKKKKPTSSSHTIYLEDEVFKKITRAAKAREMTISAFVNEVFKQMQM